MTIENTETSIIGTTLFDSQGNELSNLSLEELERIAAREYSEGTGSFPAQTDDMRGLGGIVKVDGTRQDMDWLRIVELYGPKVLKEENGPVMALGLVNDSGVYFVTYCGSQQIMPGLEKPIVRALIERGGNVYIRWWYNEPAKGKNGFYTADVRFGGDWPHNVGA